VGAGGGLVSDGGLVRKSIGELRASHIQNAMLAAPHANMLGIARPTAATRPMSRVLDLLANRPLAIFFSCNPGVLKGLLPGEGGVHF
jgi:hypothetical protein